MAIPLDYKTQILIAFLLVLLMLLMMPARAETAELVYAEQISWASATLQDYSLFQKKCSDFISYRRHTASSLGENKSMFTLNNLLKICGFHIRSYTSQAPYQQTVNQEDAACLSLQNIQAKILPFIEVSYSLNNTIALELRGHLNQFSNKKQSLSRADDNYEYTLFFGPSLYAGTPGDPTRMYTQFGLGYNVIDSSSENISVDCPPSLGTGFSVGFKRHKSDIRIGYNHFTTPSEASSQRGLHEDPDISSIFLFVTYNFDS